MVISHWCHLIEGLQTSPLDFYKLIEAALDRRQIPGLSRKRVMWPEGGVLSAKREYLRLTRKKLMFDICVAPFGTGVFVSSRLMERRYPWLLLVFLLMLVGFAALLIWSLILAAHPQPQNGDQANAPFVFLVMLVVFGVMLLAYLVIAGTVCAAILLARWFDRTADSWMVRAPRLYLLYQRITGHTTYYSIDTTLMFEKAVHAAVMEVVDQYCGDQHLKPLSEFERKPSMSLSF